MNQTAREIFEEYRDEMARTLGTEERAPHLFANQEFVEHFETKVDRLDTLIALWRDLILANRN